MVGFAYSPRSVIIITTIIIVVVVAVVAIAIATTLTTAIITIITIIIIPIMIIIVQQHLGSQAHWPAAGGGAAGLRGGPARHGPASWAASGASSRWPSGQASRAFLAWWRQRRLLPLALEERAEEQQAERPCTRLRF